MMGTIQDEILRELKINNQFQYKILQELIEIKRFMKEEKKCTHCKV